MPHAVLKAAAVVTSVALAGGVIWYRVARVNDRQTATPEGSSSTPATQPTMLMSGSKSKTLDLTGSPQQPAMLMPGSKSDVMVSGKETAPPQMLMSDSKYLAPPNPEMLMSSSKSIIITYTKVPATIPQGQIMLMVGGKSGAVMTPPAATTSKPATNPATNPATQPAAPAKGK